MNTNYCDQNGAAFAGKAGRYATYEQMENLPPGPYLFYPRQRAASFSAEVPPGQRLEE